MGKVASPQAMTDEANGALTLSAPSSAPVCALGHLPSLRVEGVAYRTPASLFRSINSFARFP